VPTFAPDGGAALVLARGFAVAFLLSVSGMLTFRTVVIPRVYPCMTDDVTDPIERGLLQLSRFNVIFAGLGLCAWLATVTSYLAGPETIGDWMDDLWMVLIGTSFGHVLLLQILLLVATGVLLGGRPSAARWRVSLVLGTAAAIGEVGHSHAYAMAAGLSFFEVSQTLHLWAAGAWLGSLLPLLLIVRLAPPSAAATAARWFSPLGKLCVVLLAGSAPVQGWVLIGTTNALIDTAYGWTALLKAGLFGVLFGFALINRYRLVPDLLGRSPDLARRRLIRSVILQSGFGLLVVLAATLLSQLRPGMDMSIPG
jgi:putative copper resistance protein D